MSGKFEAAVRGKIKAAVRGKFEAAVRGKFEAAVRGKFEAEGQPKARLRLYPCGKAEATLGFPPLLAWAGW